MISNFSRYALIMFFILYIPKCIAIAQFTYLRTLTNKTKRCELEQPHLTQQLVPNIPSVTTLKLPTQVKSYNESTQTTLLIHNYDWDSVIQLMVSKMLQTQDINPSKILLVDEIYNNTNGSLNTSEATEKLRNTLANNSKFTLISTQQLSLVKQQLRLSSQDSLSTRSKTIGIARNARAQYVLYSNATDDVNTPMLQMQLMLVKTGEIIWSDQTLIR